MDNVKDRRTHVIVVEDEAFQRSVLLAFLSGNGFRVSGVETGAGLRTLVETDPPALVLLDLHLPGEDGFSLARFLRERDSRVGIIMVTASNETIDRVVGLETGADDYVAKPFEARELLARIRAVLRRSGNAGPAARAEGMRIRMGRCILDLELRRLTTIEGEAIFLRAGEFELLKLFAEHPNRPLTRDWLLERTGTGESDAFDRAIDIRILRLRRKIEADPARPTALRTVRGAGYMFVPTD